MRERDRQVKLMLGQLLDNGFSRRAGATVSRLLSSAGDESKELSERVNNIGALRKKLISLVGAVECIMSQFGCRCEECLSKPRVEAAYGVEDCTKVYDMLSRGLTVLESPNQDTRYEGTEEIVTTLMSLILRISAFVPPDIIGLSWGEHSEDPVQVNVVLQRKALKGEFKRAGHDDPVQVRREQFGGVQTKMRNMEQLHGVDVTPNVPGSGEEN